MKTFKQLALIGPSASGKTALSIKIAQKMNAYILSLDSLSIYKEIDIVSAKPSMEARSGIKHFGVDHLFANENFDVSVFIDLYHQTYAKCLHDKKNLVIVGGTSFYLKMLIEGISVLPSISNQTKKEVQRLLIDSKKAHSLLDALDPVYMSSIEENDTYRIEKALNIYIQTGLVPSVYFLQNPPQSSITSPLAIYQIVWDRSILRERITLRTNIMLGLGLIDEVCMLEKKYTRFPNCMKSIGIKETLAYLDGVYDKKMLAEKISTNTARLAKRQTTFNNSQFRNVIKGSVEDLERLLL